MWVLCCWACMCSCLHACKWGLQARINKETALVAYSQAWSTAREIILCSGISARELTVHHLDLGGSTKKAALPGAEGAALSFSVFYGREFSSQLQRQNPLIALLVCKDSAMRQSGLWHRHKPVLDVQIFQNISCWEVIKLTPISRVARTCTWVFVCKHPELMLPLGLQSAAQSGLGQTTSCDRSRPKRMLRHAGT